MGFMKWIRRLFPSCCKGEEDEDTGAMEDRIQDQPARYRVSNARRSLWNDVPEFLDPGTPARPKIEYESDSEDENLPYSR